MLHRSNRTLYVVSAQTCVQITAVMSFHNNSPSCVLQHENIMATFMTEQLSTCYTRFITLNTSMSNTRGVMIKNKYDI